jgi:DNA-directed RNA polymerase specialized sigma24 family protein
MDGTAAYAELPEPYAVALQLHDEGVSDEAIAARLGIEPEAVGPLLRLGAAKLARLLGQRDALNEEQPEPPAQRPSAAERGGTQEESSR